MIKDDPLEACPGTQALRALIDAGHIRLDDLTVAQREDMIRQMSLIDQQAKERVHEAFCLGMKVANGPNPNSAEARSSGDEQRRRGRPKGSSTLIEKDRRVVNEMIVALHLAHIGYRSGTFKRLTVTRDIKDLLQQACRIVKTTSEESTRHRILSRIRKGEIKASDFGLAGLYFDDVVRALRSLTPGFAQKTIRRKNSV
jgi:hypothetical protein